MEKTRSPSRSNGRTGKLEISGLGGSYGLERLAHYAMTPELGPPPTTIYEYPMADDSWDAEYAAFLDDIATGRTVDPSFEDAAASLHIVEEIYADRGPPVIITRSPLRISLRRRRHRLTVVLSGARRASHRARQSIVTCTSHCTKRSLKNASSSIRSSNASNSIDEIKHPLIREMLRLTNTPTNFLEITSMSDIPAGTGLGSSGSFGTGLLLALHTMNREIVTKARLAEEACHVEIDVLGESVGKQDQYIAAYGGISSFNFHQDDSVTVEPVRASPETLANLQDNLVMFFTGYTRSASVILQDQDKRTKSVDTSMIEQLHYVKQLGDESLAAIEGDDLTKFAEIMHEHWTHKRRRSQGMTNDHIDDWYELARQNGALGGKLIGAGGGGFLMFYSEEKTRLRRAMRNIGLRELRVGFDRLGSSVVSAD